MYTYDVELDSSDWVAIVPTGTHIKAIAQCPTNLTKISCRFGISSSSRGFLLSDTDSVECAETLYAKYINEAGNFGKARLVISGD